MGEQHTKARSVFEATYDRGGSKTKKNSTAFKANVKFSTHCPTNYTHLWVLTNQFVYGWMFKAATPFLNSHMPITIRNDYTHSNVQGQHNWRPTWMDGQDR